MEKNRSFRMKKADWAILCVLLVLAAGCWIFYQLSYQPPKEQNLAVIMVDGKEQLRLNLLEETDRTLSLKESCGVPVSFQIKDQKIRFVDVDCPDHICENAGFLSMEGQTAVCMPNRVSLSIYGEEG